MAAAGGRCLLGVAALCATLAVAASLASGQGSTGPQGAVDPRRDGLEVGLGEWAVSLEATEIRPGRVTFVIRNGGTRRHGFRIRSRRHRHGGDRFERRTRLLEPGETTRLTVELESGTYRVDCYVEEPGVGDHDDLGMKATLRVSADAPLLPAQAAADTVVTIERFAFRPAALVVPAGATVVWRNADPTPHTVTGEAAGFDSGVLRPEAEFRRRFDSPGTYEYFCRIHPTMRGRVVVE